MTIFGMIAVAVMAISIIGLYLDSKKRNDDDPHMFT